MWQSPIGLTGLIVGGSFMAASFAWPSRPPLDTTSAHLTREGMLCEKCKSNLATIHITEKYRGGGAEPTTSETTHHFCEPCSREVMSGDAYVQLASSKPTVHMEFHSAPKPPDPVPPEPQIDTSKRYDIYCTEPSQRVVVYRNARFKGGGNLLSAPGSRSLVSQFIELEQANGQTVFVARHAVFRFCEPGTLLMGETIPKE